MAREFADSRPVHLPGARKVSDLSGPAAALMMRSARTAPGVPQAEMVAAPEERIRVTLVLCSKASATANEPDDAPGPSAVTPDGQGASLQQLAEELAPADNDVELVRQFAIEHELDVVEVSRLRHDVVLEGTVSALSKAFHVNLAEYEHSQGTYRAHDEHIHLPDELHGRVEAVLGLDTIPCHHHFGIQVTNQIGSAKSTGSSLMNPLDAAGYYEFPDCSKGAGQRIALLQFGGGYYEDDIRDFMKGVDKTWDSSKLHSICLEGGSNSPLEKAKLAEITKAVNIDGQAAIRKYSRDIADWSHTLEVTMDIELVAALAPEADIDVYFIGTTTQNFRRALFALTGHEKSAGGQDIKPATVISDSWGKTESGYAGTGLDSVNGALETLARANITVCCASGDFGSVGASPDKPTETANVCFPASSPYALACGGTTLMGSTGMIDGETAWNERINGFHLASTGGISGRFALPAWQSDARVPNPESLAAPGTWMSNKASNTSGFLGRGVPDVAASAEIAGGFRVILGGVETAGGGTSAAAPLWAALLARINQKRDTNLGWVNPLLYKSMGTAAFRQAASGNNKVGESDIPSYSVTQPDGSRPAWNPCTGLGTPVGTALANALAVTPAKL